MSVAGKIFLSIHMAMLMFGAWGGEFSNPKLQSAYLTYSFSSASGFQYTFFAPEVDGILQPELKHADGTKDFLLRDLFESNESKIRFGNLLYWATSYRNDPGTFAEITNSIAEYLKHKDPKLKNFSLSWYEPRVSPLGLSQFEYNRLSEIQTFDFHGVD